MTDIDANKVTFTISEDDLVSAIALLTDLRDFCNEQHEERVTETTAALTTAIETMQAFYCERFGGDDEAEKEVKLECSEHLLPA